MFPLFFVPAVANLAAQVFSAPGICHLRQKKLLMPEGGVRHSKYCKINYVKASYMKTNITKLIARQCQALCISQFQVPSVNRGGYGMLFLLI